MFSLFSKDRNFIVHDVIYLDEQGYHAGIAKWLRENTNGIVAVWFPRDLEKLKELPEAAPGDRFMLAERLSYHAFEGKPVLFSGHYPLLANELKLFNELGITEIPVYSHLDMPLLRHFGSERIKEMMAKMGMNNDEPLSHPMITGAIKHAQEKIAADTVTDMFAQSEEEWMKMNVKTV